MGDPSGRLAKDKVVIPEVTQEKVICTESQNNTPEKLAVALLLLLFSREELAHENCTKPIRGDIHQLDTNQLWAIKCKKHFTYMNTLLTFFVFAGHVNYIFPIDPEQEKERWNILLRKCLNLKCRQMRIKSENTFNHYMVFIHHYYYMHDSSFHH